MKETLCSPFPAWQIGWGEGGGNCPGKLSRELSFKKNKIFPYKKIGTNTYTHTMAKTQNVLGFF